MTMLPILIAPHPVLKKNAEPVETVDDATRTLMDDMLESMYAANGVGLAAPQVGVSRRIIVVDTAREDETRRPIRMANPELVWTSEESLCAEEGCLSLPEQYANVTRPERVRVKYLDHDNQIRELEAGGLLARCIQHEMDHLIGTLFVDHISALRRGIIMRRLAKAAKDRT